MVTTQELVITLEGLHGLYWGEETLVDKHVLHPAEP